MSPTTLIVLIVAILLNAFANVFLKASAIYENDGSLIKKIFNLWLILGILSFGLAFLFYRYVLKEIPLSIAYPIMTTSGFAVVLLVSRFLFHEKLALVQWIGIGFLILGIWLIASKS
ncbi:MAG: SMR family transporter [Leptospiraceae bacterium]|nr:SMR family transporter [Leptospiraceae bacterium]MDW7975458.1 SMR family transporter [Leptospiraceae bacterium]